MSFNSKFKEICEENERENLNAFLERNEPALSFIILFC